MFKLNRALFSCCQWVIGNCTACSHYVIAILNLGMNYMYFRHVRWGKPNLYLPLSETLWTAFEVTIEITTVALPWKKKHVWQAFTFTFNKKITTGTIYGQMLIFCLEKNALFVKGFYSGRNFHNWLSFFQYM